MKQYIEDMFDEAIKAHKEFALDHAGIIEEIAKTIVECFENGNKVLIFGNGGSAADAQHIAAEFASRFVMERPPLAAIALTTDTSLLTAVGNDYSFDEVFEKQVSALANPGDVVWGISTSGNSENVIRGLKRAIKCDAKTIGFAGRDGGKMPGLCDKILVVDHQSTARIQEIHIMSAHIICGLVDEIMFGRFAG